LDFKKIARRTSVKEFMDKKYIFGIFIVFVILAGIGIILLNPGISSAAKVSQNLYNSPLLIAAAAWIIILRTSQMT